LTSADWWETCQIAVRGSLKTVRSRDFAVRSHDSLVRGRDFTARSRDSLARGRDSVVRGRDFIARSPVIAPGIREIPGSPDELGGSIRDRDGCLHDIA
jgi:hypothetical protein